MPIFHRDGSLTTDASGDATTNIERINGTLVALEMTNTAANTPEVTLTGTLEIDKLQGQGNVEAFHTNGIVTINNFGTPAANEPLVLTIASGGNEVEYDFRLYYSDHPH